MRSGIGERLGGAPNADEGTDDSAPTSGSDPHSPEKFVELLDKALKEERRETETASSDAAGEPPDAAGGQDPSGAAENSPDTAEFLLWASGYERESRVKEAKHSIEFDAIDIVASTPRRMGEEASKLRAPILAELIVSATVSYSLFLDDLSVQPEIDYRAFCVENRERLSVDEKSSLVALSKLVRTRNDVVETITDDEDLERTVVRAYELLNSESDVDPTEEGVTVGGVEAARSFRELTREIDLARWWAITCLSKRPTEEGERGTSVEVSGVR